MEYIEQHTVQAEFDTVNTSLFVGEMGANNSHWGLQSD